MNPAAGRGRRARSPEALDAAFGARGLAFERVTTEGPGHGGRILRERGPAFDAVTVVGGDGTLHEVIQALDLDRHRLGLVPWGSGNDFAWMEGWPADLDAALDRIAAGRERRVDLGRWRAELASGGAREGRFHNNVGFGFEAEVNRASHARSRLKGPLLYVAALLRTLPRYRAWPLRITWEGSAHDGPTALATVQNGKRVGGAFLLAPAARTDDGRLDLVTAGNLGLARMLLLLPRTFGGGHVRSPAVRTAQSSAFTVESAEGVPAYVDGEFLDAGVIRLTVAAMPGALRTF